MQPPREGPERAPRHRPTQPPHTHPAKRAGLALALALLLSSSVARAERPVVFRWIDESGIAHYTTQRDRIPSEFEDSVQQIGQPGAPSPSAVPATSVGGAPLPETPPVPNAPVAPTSPAVSSAPPTPAAPAVAPAPVAKPSGPRVMPEGEFEEAPLGSKDTAAPPAPAPAPAPSARSAPPESPPSEDVAAPPPGFLRESAPETKASPPPAESQAAPAAAVTNTPLTPAEASDLDTRIASLEDQVNRDQAAIQNILSQPREADGPRVAERPDFREIAQRLPALQADLKVLREQRARQSGP